MKRGALLGVLVVLTACSSGTPASSGPHTSGPAASGDAAYTLTSNVDGRRVAAVDTVVALQAGDATIESVRVSAPDQPDLAGSIAADGTSWTASELLEPGLRYRVVTDLTTAHGDSVTNTRHFRTQTLSLDQQTYASMAPLAGETVGVGMPVIVTFDIPVTDRAAVERQLSVTATPAQVGAWRWLSDTEVHWRPRTYWKPGSTVRVRADINSVNVGGGIYGQSDRDVTFTIGDSVIHRVHVQTHEMVTFINGERVRTTPISAGKPGFETRSGIKVIIEKFRRKTMDAATTGIEPGDPEYYLMTNVEYAERVTYSGEFLHAAPWSLGSQGSANVSHGCVGMSTEDAKWIYDHTTRGDVVEVTGTDRQMTLTNGFGDWNLPFAVYAQGSALAE